MFKKTVSELTHSLQALMDKEAESLEQSKRIAEMQAR